MDTFYQVHRAGAPDSTGWFSPVRQFMTFSAAEEYIVSMMTAGYNDGDSFLIVENRMDGKENVAVYKPREVC